MRIEIRNKREYKIDYPTFFDWSKISFEDNINEQRPNFS